MQDWMLSPSVVVLCGPVGSGKTRALDAIHVDSPGRLQLLTAPRPGERINGWVPDFTNSDAVVLDRLGDWPADALPALVLGLEHSAEIADKKLILVTRSPNELGDRGIQLNTEPLVCEVLGPRHMRITFRKRSLVLDEAALA
jgi:hypothetical protein